MSARHSLYVVAYDVSDDRERLRVDKVLGGFGFRVQKSVYECRLSRHARGQLRERLENLQLRSGFVLGWRLASAQRDLAVGNAPPLPDADAAFIR